MKFDRSARRKVAPGVFISLLLLATADAAGQELPKPTLANSVLVSIEHSVQDSAEVDYIKANFPFGLYAWLSFSLTAYTVPLDWHAPLAGADAGIQAFKDQVNALVAAAKAKSVRLHIVVVSGMGRGVSAYREAKTEDIRNAQWFNDNKLCSDSQVLDPGAMDVYIWGTFSRYARKMQANLEAKARAALAFLKQRMDEEPDVIVAVSGWGETELSYHRIDHSRSLQDYFCDFSPFAVMEFRDWLQHAGMYDGATGKYAGQGYSGGGAKYQGAAGLALFNADFGTAFASWDLRYYNWSLADDYDAVPEDYVNPDPNLIPYASYVHGGMMPASGPQYVAGGFDPPRTMQPGDSFYDLWNDFRETMVRNHVHDLARWVQEAGIPPDRWYTHQIPADYLFGTQPSLPPASMNARYHSSASPLWTADALPFVSTGATIYDVKFPTWFARTTQHIYPVISGMGTNWAVMEFDPELYPPGMGVAESPADFILEQYLRPYSYRAHLINFWRWIDAPEHLIKGMNKEVALREFVRRVRDKARSVDLNKVYDPPKVIGLSGQYQSMAAAGAAMGAAGSVRTQAVGVRLQVTGKIWDGEPWNWKDWGDLARFEVFRSTTPGFPADDAHRVGSTAEYVYDDTTAVYGSAYYYKWRAENVNGVRGPASDEVLVNTAGANVPVLSVDRTTLGFGAQEGQASPSAQRVYIRNTGASGTTINWQAADNRSWIGVAPASGTGDGFIDVSVDTAGIGAGTYSGQVTVTDPNAANSPQAVAVNLTVYAAGEDAEPYGSFDAPVDGSTVRSSIPVTGWALDDIGVTLLEVVRLPVPSDPPERIRPDGYVYIGRAFFVRGARLDVKAAFPGVPNNDRAGWGYMLLTNFLPNQGNGVFTLAAIAHDGTGHRKNLGHKTITCDNANAVKPFGAIDTPTQGGVASGAVFYNFGWALTPPPAFIPTDGSTIRVFVNAVNLGNPAYGFYRDDIATLFPGYLNSTTGAGVFTLNTTQFPDGIHNIAWGVIDSAGQADGIGSRFFEIQNSSPLSINTGTHHLIVLKSGQLSDVSPIYVRRGLDPGSPAEVVFPDADGIVRIGLAVDERVAVYSSADEAAESEEKQIARGRALFGLGRRPGSEGRGRAAEGAYSAHLVYGNEVLALPAGSTFDSERGTLYWLPGPGFLGEYDFLVVRRVGNGLGTHKTIRVTVLSK